MNKVPEGKNWQYEPKWDGFRCLFFRDGGKVYLQSKSGQSLTRYFPELVAAVASLKAKRSCWMAKLSYRTERHFRSTTSSAHSPSEKPSGPTGN